jgi:hypothetical protein
MTRFLLAWLSGLWVLSSAVADEIHNEADGIVRLEVENTNSPLGLWEKKSDLAGFSGSGYLEFTGNEFDLGDADSPLSYHFKINRGGTYVLDLHCAKKTIGEHADWANDCYVRVVGDYSAGPGPHDVPMGNASLSLLKRDTKYFGGKSNAWEWSVGDWHFTGGRLDPGGKKNKRTAIYNFKAGETYTLVISGRSKAFRIDRAVFRHDSVAKKDAHDLSIGESEKGDGKIPSEDNLDKTITASSFDSESHADDEEIIRSNGSVVDNIKDGSWICFKAFDFGLGSSSSIEVQASSANTAGGEMEVRTGSGSGPLLGTVNIFKTREWNDFEYFSANIDTVSGRQDLYLVFKGRGAENLFNLKNFMIRSGVSVDEKLAATPIRPPAGRVAFLADGNSPDPDDIGGTAAALAMLRAAGLDNRLVYAAHSCDLVKTANISEADELKRQQMLQTACDGTVSRWDGFDEITFWNCRTQRKEAINQLTDQINASSETDPLWIIEAGEPHIIGYALEAAEPEKRLHVKLLTHHPVNDGSGDFFKWKQILDFGAEIVRIPDQNGYNAHIGRGLQRPLWAFYWARDHKDPRIQWLWKQGKLAEQDGVVGFQNGKFDISDAGMVYYWITGANSANGGYRQPTVHDVRELLEEYVAREQ